MAHEKANGHLVGLSQSPKSWDDCFASPVQVTDDFMAEHEQPNNREREADDDFIVSRQLLCPVWRCHCVGRVAHLKLEVIGDRDPINVNDFSGES